LCRVVIEDGVGEQMQREEVEEQSHHNEQGNESL